MPPIPVIEKYPDRTKDLLYNIYLKLGGAMIIIEEKYYDTGDDLLYAILKQLFNGAGPGSGTSTIKAVSADFADATHYNNPAIAGKTLGIFFNEINRFLEDTEFAYTATGIQVLIPGFNSTLNNYTLYISIVTVSVNPGV